MEAIMFQWKMLGLTAAAALTFAGGAFAQDDNSSADLDRGVPNVDVDVQHSPGDVDVDVTTEKPETVKVIEDVDVDVDTNPILIGEDAPNIVTGVGTMIQVGGGVQNFTRAARETTNPGGMWDARAVVGSRSILGAEAGYHGSAQDINAPGLDTGTWLMSNGLEAALRLQAPIPAGESALIEPYAFGGVGGQFYNLVNDNGNNTSSIKDGDVVMDVPVGVGLAAGFGGVTLDGRYTYRHTMGNELLGNDLYGTSSAALNNWSLGANLGFEF
jgi:hypothetical protein